MGVLCWSLFWYALLYVLSSFAIILTGERERAGCFAFIVFWIPGDCMGPVALPHGAVGWSAVCVVVIPDHTHLLFYTEQAGTGFCVSNLGTYLFCHALTLAGFRCSKAVETSCVNTKEQTCVVILPNSNNPNRTENAAKIIEYHLPTMNLYTKSAHQHTT